MVKIILDLPYEGLDEFLLRCNKLGVRILVIDTIIPNHTIRKQKRAKTILDKIMEPSIRLETLFRRCTRRGYISSRRVFSRDIDYLCEGGFIEKEVIIGGSSGSHTIIKKSNEWR